MISPSHIKALTILNEKLNDIEWCVVGSTNLELQGVAIEAKDIDIQIEPADRQKVQTLLNKYCTQSIKFTEDNFFRSYFGQFYIEGIKVDVMANLEIKKYGKWKSLPNVLRKSKVINYKGIAIKCADLKAERSVYKQLGRSEKVDAIKKEMRST